MATNNENSKINLPDALKTKPMATINNMNVDTNILDPVVINQTFARFVLEKKGILDAGSVFTFALTNGHADMDNRVALCVKTGIHALVSRAVLRVGTKIISNVEDYAHYQTIKRQFKTTEEKQLKDMIKVGTHEGLEPSNSALQQLQMSAPIYAPNTPNDSLALPAIALTSLATTTPTFQIKLSELFPMLRSVQLPLFVFNEPVSIELTFRTQAAAGENGNLAVCQADPGAINYTQAVNLVQNSVKFLADYLTYDQGTMNATAKQVMSQNGIVMPYEDLVLTISNLGNNAGLGATPGNEDTTTEIGVAGRVVRSLVVHTDNGVRNNLLGIYGSTAFQNPDEYNLRVNDILQYPNDIVREPQKQYELSRVFGRDIEVHNCEYSLDLLTNKQDAGNGVNNNIIRSSTFLGRNQQDLQGNQHIIGVDLSKSPLNFPGNGVQVGQKPIQFFRKFRRVNNARENPGNITQRVFSLVERQMVIKNGLVQVSA